MLPDLPCPLGPSPVVYIYLSIFSAEMWRRAVSAFRTNQWRLRSCGTVASVRACLHSPAALRLLCVSIDRRNSIDMEGDGHKFEKGDSNRCRNAYERILHAALRSSVLEPHKKNKHISVGRCRMIAIDHGVAIPTYEALSAVGFSESMVRRPPPLASRNSACGGSPCNGCDSAGTLC